jgi:hypothetical protein
VTETLALILALCALGVALVTAVARPHLLPEAVAATAER